MDQDDHNAYNLQYVSIIYKNATTIDNILTASRVHPAQGIPLKD